MSWSRIVGAGLVAGLTMVCAAAAAQERAGPASLDETLRPYLSRAELPALAAAVVVDGRLVASGAVGTRRLGTDTPVTLTDRFHIGSDTKAMTALLAGMLVDEGKLRWDSTIGEVFPEFRAKMVPDIAGVTLEQLLSHAGGVPGDNDAQGQLLVQSFAVETRNLDALRLWLVEHIVAMPLASKPGTRFEYANMGYVIAGAMIERASGRTWEELIVERLFGPLGLSTAGLGPQSSLGRVDAPLGHLPRDGAPPLPILAGPDGDNPEVIGPAGTAHMSVLDFATWAAWNATLGKSGPALVRSETLQRLHTPVIDMPARPGAAPGTPAVLGRYGHGWGMATLPLSPEPFLTHAGSNGLNLAEIYLQPRYGFALVLMTNVGGQKADAALKALAAELYARFGPARP